MILTFKSSRVKLKKFTPALQHIFITLSRAEEWTSPDDLPDEFVFTSINDGRHSKDPPSRHYSDEAVDGRVHNFPSTAAILRFREDLQAELNDHPGDPGKFRVIFERRGTPHAHLHIQVKKNERFSG